MADLETLAVPADSVGEIQVDSAVAKAAGVGVRAIGDLKFPL